MSLILGAHLGEKALILGEETNSGVLLIIFGEHSSFLGSNIRWHSAYFGVRAAPTDFGDGHSFGGTLHFWRAEFIFGDSPSFWGSIVHTGGKSPSFRVLHRGRILLGLHHSSVDLKQFTHFRRICLFMGCPFWCYSPILVLHLSFITLTSTGKKLTIKYSCKTSSRSTL